MNSTGTLQLDLDRIVRLVLGDLNGEAVLQSQANPGAPEKRPESDTNPNVQVAPSPNEVVLTEKVVTVDVVRRYIGAAPRRWILATDAFLTPAAKDELRGHDIELIRGTSCPVGITGHVAGNLAVQTSEGMFVLAVHAAGNEPVLPSFVAWVEEAANPQTVRKSCIMATIGELSTIFAGSDERKGILLTEYPALALLLANRRREFRACPAVGMDQLKKDAPLLGANLLVVHSKEIPVFLLRQMTQWFLAQSMLKEPDFLTPAWR